MTTAFTAMFPLGTVLFPGVGLPLRVFEPRYQVMLEDLSASNPTLGVVLIERGHEVGGDDMRSTIGTLAEVEEHQLLAEGQHAILIRGRHRIRVESWLDDDPYPRALTVPWPDEDSLSNEDTAADDVFVETEAVLRQLLATATEMGYSVPAPTFETPADIQTGSFFLAAKAPIGPFDQQKLLVAPEARIRLAMLHEMLVEQLSILRAN